LHIAIVIIGVFLNWLSYLNRLHDWLGLLGNANFDL
jgi:hypothetical protein